MMVRWTRSCLSLSLLLLIASAASAQAEKETPVEKVRKSLEQTIKLNFVGQDFQEVITHLKEKSGVNFVVDQNIMMGQAIPLGGFGLGGLPGANGQNIEIKADNAKLSEVLQKFLNPFGYTYVVLDSSVLITTEENALNRVFGQRINVNVSKEPLDKILKELARGNNFNMVVDPRISGMQNPVTLKLENTALETSVKLLAELAGLKAVRMDNVLFITDEARADKMRLENPAPRPNNNRGWPGVFGAGLGGAGFGGVGNAPVRIQINPPNAPPQK